MTRSDSPSILLATTQQGISGLYSLSSLYQLAKFLYVIFLWTSNTWMGRQSDELASHICLCHCITWQNINLHRDPWFLLADPISPLLFILSSVLYFLRTLEGQSRWALSRVHVCFGLPLWLCTCSTGHLLLFSIVPRPCGDPGCDLKLCKRERLGFTIMQAWALW